MSERLRQLLDETEALQHYPSIKNEREKLQSQFSQLESDLKNKEGTIIKLNKLQTVFAGKTSTLEDVEKYVQETYHDEIQREADKKFSVEKEQLTADLLNQLLKLPREEMGGALQKRLSVDIQNGVNTTLKNREQWPQWFKQSIEENIGEEVRKRLNEIYWANVREGIRKAKEEEWNPYLDHYLQEKITPFCNTILLGRFIHLLTNQHIYLTCEQCKTLQIFQLSLGDISCLLEKGDTVFPCSTPNCIEGIINRHPTYIHLYLGDAISILLGKPQIPL
ncbi:MAG: hypothetical protein V1850_00195 [Candidatus Bathyarchaeota archaeon]